MKTKTGNKYEKKFIALLGKLNANRKDNIKYHSITEQISYLVGEMIGHIDSLEFKERTR